jgi:hypothetical protein
VYFPKDEIVNQNGIAKLEGYREKLGMVSLSHCFIDGVRSSGG